jgi:hypothetical protein
VGPVAWRLVSPAWRLVSPVSCLVFFVSRPLVPPAWWCVILDMAAAAAALRTSHLPLILSCLPLILSCLPCLSSCLPRICSHLPCLVSRPPCLSSPFPVVIPPTSPMSSACEAGGGWCVHHDVAALVGSSVGGSGATVLGGSLSPHPAVHRAVCFSRRCWGGVV